MIVCRTPLRMSFVGGGSDMESYYKHHGGAVVSTSIDKYIYLCANQKFDPWGTTGQGCNSGRVESPPKPNRSATPRVGGTSA